MGQRTRGLGNRGFGNWGGRKDKSVTYVSGLKCYLCIKTGPFVFYNKCYFLVVDRDFIVMYRMGLCRIVRVIVICQLLI